MNEAPIESSVSDLVPIADLDQFVKALTEWHAAKVQTCKHLLAVPQGASFQIGDESPLMLEGPAHAGFIFGVEMALMQFGELPFVAEVEDAAIEAVVDQTVAEDVAAG